MKNIGIAFIALLAGMASCAARPIPGDGKVISENRTVADFSALEASGGFDIQWTSAPSSLSITTDQDLLPHIQTVVAEGTLRISADQAIAPTKGVKIVLSSGSLKEVDLRGAVHFTAKQVSGEKLRISSAGAVSAEVAGEVGELTAKLTGASNLKALSLKAKAATVSLTGASNGDVCVSEHLKASIVGAGSISYTGDPRVEQSVLGVGKVWQRK